MKVLITGGAGFIGSNVVNKLYSLNHEVVVIDNLSKQIHGEVPEDSVLYKSIADKCEFHKEAVENIKDWHRYLDGVDVIVNLAAETGTGQSMYQIAKYTEINSLSTASMLEHLVTHPNNVKKVIIASSRSIYGEGEYFCEEHGRVFPKDRTVDNLNSGFFELTCPICGDNISPIGTTELAAINPQSIYAITKLNQEQLTLVACNSIGVDAIALRFQNVYGPGQSLSNPYTGILSIFSGRMLEGKDINIFEDGLESRDFVYIDDVVDSVLLAMTAGKGVNGSFNIGSGCPTTVLQVVDLLAKMYKLDPNYKVSGNYRIGDIRHNFADLSKASESLGFYPKVDLATGIEKFADWVLSQDERTSDYEKSLEELKSLGLFK
ncbi:epimerase [Enterovibrio norvegicus]|uniref:NAD-dependent epimerase/dehydratase family protein n=1 Tax=Enterovibrio norvegicus TaxID=188144 RepID=UPI0002FB1902|nr:NAD-dependent epimerase/dehydratase family protein [Enterovibrio norvegicus]OEE57325.1 epimerase [Enterovibrio norvegicus]